MTKRWYDFFVVTDRPDSAAGKDAPAQPAKASGTASKRAGDLATPIPESTFSKPVADPTVFTDIYAAAKIATPAHGYTILKVAEMLASSHLRDQPATVRQKSILVALDAAGVSVDSIVEDAVQRDRALDTYQKVLEKALGDLRAECDAENRRLEQEIQQRVAELRARIDENAKRVKEEEATLASWRDRKHAEENRIAEAVNYFVSENPISTAAPPMPQGGDHVRQDR